MNQEGANNKDVSSQITELIKKNNYKLISDKIIRILKTIKNDPYISSKRWVWELMQNATDVKYENEKISVQIILDENQLVFKHNGKYFKINHILGLLQQVSSKDSQNLEGQTGKFGTGFIGTHLLSDVIDVKGILYLKDNDFREFKVSLDRSEQKSEILAQKIEKSIEMFYKMDEQKDNFKPKPNYLENRKETDYDTSFTYHLTDEDKKQSAKEGLMDLINTLPTTLITQNKKIKQVEIIDNIEHKETIYTHSFDINEKINDITESSVKIITKQNGKDIIEEKSFLSYLKAEEKKEILRLITEVQKKDGIIYLLKREPTKPVLYRNFPLIGSNEFHLPFIVDGFDFNPLESRSGLFLNGFKNESNIDSKENIKILKIAYNSFIEFIKRMIEKYDFLGLENRYILASSKMPKPIVNFDSNAASWFLERQKIFRQNLREISLVKYGRYYKFSELLLPIFGGQYNNEFHSIVSQLNINKKILPEKGKEYENWYDIIIKENDDISGLNIKDNPFIKSWGENINKETEKNEIYYIYNIENLLQDIVQCKNIKNLSEKLEKEKSLVIISLNNLINFMKKNCQYEKALNDYPIIPNRNGVFKKIGELYSDHKNRIPKVISEIYDSISEVKLDDELIDSEMNVEYLGDILKIKDFDYISKYLNKYINEKNDIEKIKKFVVYPLLSIKVDNLIIKIDLKLSNALKEKISKIYQFLTQFYNLQEKQIIVNNNDIEIPIDLWDHAINFWYNEHPKEIESYKNIQGLKNYFLDKNIDENKILKWMNEYLGFLKSTTTNYKNFKIFPNQNNEFCILKDVHFDSDFPEEFKDILKKYCNKDKREILLHKEIISYSGHQTLSEFQIAKQIKEEFEDLLKDKIKNKKILDKMAFEILCLYPKNKGRETIRKYIETIIYPKRTPNQLRQNPIKYLGLAEVVFNKKFKIKNINTNNLEYKVFIDYIIELICEEISICQNYETAKNKFYGIKNENDLAEFLTKVITFIWDNQNCEYPIKNCLDYEPKKAVFLTMNNELKKIDDVFIKEDFKEKIKNEDLLIDIPKNKHINIDYRSKLINKRLNQNLLKNKNNRKSLFDLKDICDKIDRAITQYDQTYNNNKVTYDNDFFTLISDIKKIECEDKVKEELFPYFWKNRSRISVTCLNEKDADNLLNRINNENIQPYIKLLDMFQDKKNVDQILHYGNISGGISNFFEDIQSSINFKMNQKFIFTLKSNGNNNETISESVPVVLSPETISFHGHEYEYNNIIEFEISEIFDTSSNKKTLKIENKKR